MNYYIFLFLFFVSFVAFPQRKCAFHHEDNHEFEEYLQQHILQKRNSRTNEEEKIYTIPVVVHVIHNNESGIIGGTGNNNISEEQIFSQIQALNEDFRRLNADTSQTPEQFKEFAVDTKIEFCLANRTPDGQATTGITRTYSNKLPFDPYSNKDNNTLKSLIYWNSAEYLNIWVTELSDNILGYAQFPSNSKLLGLANNEGGAETDGVVINHTSFGKRIGTASKGNYSYGRTATHEIGHWLGLLHIWGNTESCSSSDYCNDTPEQGKSTSGCPEELPYTCNNYNMISNFMDYTNDVCMNIFTKNQKERMRAVLEISPRRQSLSTSLGCCGVKNMMNFPFVETFENNLEDWNIENGWTQKNGSLISSTTTTNIAYTPYLNGKNIKNPILQLNMKGNTTTNKIVILYQVICNPIWDTLVVIENQDFSEATNLFLSVPELSNQEAIVLQIHTSGTNEIALNDIQLYQKSDNLDFIIYPNPLKDNKLTIKTLLTGIHTIRVEIFDAVGNKIYLDENQEVLGNIFHLENLALVSGIYFIRLSDEINTFVKQFSVTRD